MNRIILLAVIISTLHLFGLFSIEYAYADCSDKPYQYVNWEGCRKRNLMLDEVDLKKANLQGADFTSADMRHSEFDGADFHKAILVRVAFDESSAQGVNFEKAVGYRVSFQGVDLLQAIFRKSEMQRTNFSRARLSEADFSKSDFGRARFDGAIMNDNDFSFANIAHADFRKAVLGRSILFKGAYFFQTRIEGVDLTHTMGLQQWQIDMACGNDATQLPAGLKKPESWPCIIE